MPGASLGKIAGGNLYTAYGGAGISGPLTLTTDVDVPASTPTDPVCLLLFVSLAPFGHFDGVHYDTLGFSDFTIADDAPDLIGGIAANDYATSAPFVAEGGGNAYGFGRPSPNVPGSFDIAESQNGEDGGTCITIVSCSPTRPIPAGSTITLDFTQSDGPTLTWMGATLVGATGVVATPDLFLSGRALDPAYTGTGDFSSTPISGHTFDSAFIGTEILFAIAWSGDHVLDPVTLLPDTSKAGVDSSQTMIDYSGLWTKLNSDGADVVDQLGGVTYSIFEIDTSASFDHTQPIMQFENDALGFDTTTPELYGGFLVIKLEFYIPPPPGDAVFRNHYYLPGKAAVGGNAPTPDDGDPAAAEGIVLALPNGALEMGQTWTRLDE